MCPLKKLLSALFLLSAISFSQNFTPPQISVRELPPEPFPAGSCTTDRVGYLGISRDGKDDNTHLTDSQIGEYVRIRLSQGYSVTLYPQASGKIFAMAKCESAKR